MTNDSEEPPILLDKHRGMAAQVATDARRESSAVEADQEALRLARAELEHFLFAAPADSWPEAAERAKYLLRLLAATADGQDSRVRQLIDAVLEDFRRLAGESSPGESSPRESPPGESPPGESLGAGQPVGERENGEQGGP